MRPVAGSVEIDVDEIRNTGKFEARLQIPEGALVLGIDRFHEFNPCQSGGVAAYIYEHGDSGCGDTNWPKTFVYVAGWGYGGASLDGQSTPTTRCTSWSRRGFATGRPSRSTTRC